MRPLAAVTGKVTHVVSTRDAHANGGAAIAAAHKANLPVVLEAFVDACIAAGGRLSEQPFLLAGEAREEPGAVGGARKRRREEEKPKTMKVVVKGKGAVDVESGMADNAHVLQKGDNVYSATLNRTDLAAGLNSFYVLQIIQSDSDKTCYLWRKWGRIGTTVKNNKIEKMPEAECVKEFTKLFLEKTGNDWADRTADRFRQAPGKFSVMELGINSEELDQQLVKNPAAAEQASTLQPAVKRLIDLIFDMDLMRQSLLEMEIDLTKMPLGALSRSQIQRGYGVLTDIQTIIQTTDDDFDRRQRLPPASSPSPLL